MERKDVISHCLTYKSVYEDYPFRAKNWCVIRHRENRKVFAWIFDREGYVWVNVKCDPLLIGALRNQPGIYPAYHMNKTAWLSVALDGSVADEQVKSLIEISFDATGR